MRNSRHILAPYSMLAAALLILACGKDGGSQSSSSSARQEEQERAGKMFKSQLLPLNSLVAGSSLGLLEWNVGPSGMSFHLAMSNTPEDLEHFQAIHSGNQCPTDSADLNADGIIDMKELEKVSGDLLFALDSDLSSAENGHFAQSRSNEYGNYVYSGQMANSHMRSIASDLSPVGKVVVVYGVNQNFSLPSSVYEGSGNKHRFVPISCGVIKAAPPQNLY